MDAAGLFSVIVPKRWGGAGLGPREGQQNRGNRLAPADCSTAAWVSTFFIFHNWFLCRFPLESSNSFTGTPRQSAAPPYGRRRELRSAFTADIASPDDGVTRQVCCMRRTCLLQLSLTIQRTGSSSRAKTSSYPMTGTWAKIDGRGNGKLRHHRHQKYFLF